LRNRYFLLADAFLFTASTVAAFALRFEGFAWGPEYSRAALLYALISIPLKLVIAYRTGLYERLWRHAGVLELERLILRCLRKEPDRRYQTIRDVSLELQEIKEESDSGRLSAPIPARAQPRGLVAVATAVAAGLVIIAAAGWLFRSRAAPPPPAMRVVPLTSLNGAETWPRLSPDGEQVAFSWDNNEHAGTGGIAHVHDAGAVGRLHVRHVGDGAVDRDLPAARAVEPGDLAEPVGARLRSARGGGGHDGRSLADGRARRQASRARGAGARRIRGGPGGI